MLASKDTLEECCHTIKLDTGPPDPLVDDVLRIHVSGLVLRAKITIHVTVKEGKYTFGSSGCYYADDNGNVDVGQIPSVMGTYTGKNNLVSCFTIEMNFISVNLSMFKRRRITHKPNIKPFKQKGFM